MKSISLINISFAYCGCADLFRDLSVVFSDTKIVAIVGDNGCGKSTLLKIINGDLMPDSGRVVRNATCAYLNQINPHNGKSGGQRQMAEISRIFESGADILLFDEPTNNLDSDARELFFQRLYRHQGGAVIVSHDRDLLRRVDTIVELSCGTITVYGGNYDFYVNARDAMRKNIESKYIDTQKRIATLNSTLLTAQNTRSHHEAKQQKERNNARRSRLEANALKGHSQETEARARRQIQQKISEQLEIQQNLSAQLRDDVIKIPMPSKPFYSKDLVIITNMFFAYGANRVFDNFDFTLYGGQHIRITGNNGCGKSTLLKIINGDLLPNSGTVKTFGRIAYLNQDLSLLNPELSVVENIMNISGALKHDAHAIAANFGFRGNASNKRVGVLSGGELLRATLAAVLGGTSQPDLLILDEPTNNLDIKSIGVLESALNQYRGAILLVSHDEEFCRNIKITETICLV